MRDTFSAGNSIPNKIPRPPVLGENSDVSDSFVTPETSVKGVSKDIPLEDNMLLSDFTNVSVDSVEEEEFFDDVPRTLTVNEQPFGLWLKRVSVALLTVSVIVLAATYFSSAPLELGLMTLGVAWVIIIALTASEAIIPYKKTRFNLVDKTFTVGQQKPKLIADIEKGVLVVSKKQIKLLLYFGDKSVDNFCVPIKRNRYFMKLEDLLALRTIVPHTSIVEFNDSDVFVSSSKGVEVSKYSLNAYVESFI